jgi:peptidoglycan/xylan/chitin deacetylase (PgdA/CDA1 family)
MPEVILTFDDGPEPEHTPRILDELAKEGVQALFFIRGEKLQSPGTLDILRRAANEGHLIGNHTFSHPNLTQVSPEEIRSEILRTHEIISKFEPKQKLFRPPYGSCDKTVRAVAKKLDYEIVLWDVNSGDWQPGNNPSAWVEIAMEQIRTRRRSICLCHDSAPTADHLGHLIARVRQLSKYRFVRFDSSAAFWSDKELLRDRLTFLFWRCLWVW